MKINQDSKIETLPPREGMSLAEMEARMAERCGKSSHPDLKQSLNDIVFEARLTEDVDHYDGKKKLSVTVFARGIHLDRPQCYAWGLKLSHRRLAERLMTAVRDGAVLRPEGIRIDTGGESYLSTRCSILARIMNAELSRLGY